MNSHIKSNQRLTKISEANWSHLMRFNRVLTKEI